MKAPIIAGFSRLDLSESGASRRISLGGILVLSLLLIATIMFSDVVRSGITATWIVPAFGAALVWAVFGLRTLFATAWADDPDLVLIRTAMTLFAVFSLIYHATLIYFTWHAVNILIG